MFSFQTFQHLQSDFAYTPMENGTLLSCSRHLTNAEYDNIKYGIEACGGHWREWMHGFFFANSSDVVRSQIRNMDETTVFKHVEQQRFQIENQFYRTPQWLAEKMVSLAGVHELRNAHILEPSAGDGMIVREILKAIGSNLDRMIVAVEPARENVECLKTIFALPNVLKIEEMTFEEYTKQYHRNGLYSYDAIIMNPPFAHERDLRHILIAYDLLAPGGTLIALAAKNSLYYDRFTTHAFNLFLESHGAIVEDIPYGTFNEVNTNVDVVLIQLHKL